MPPPSGPAAASRIVVMNKVDLLPAGAIRLATASDTVAISALRSRGLDQLLSAMARWFSAWREEVTVTLPAGRGDLVAMARRDGEVLGEEYSDGTVSLRARVSAPVAGRLRKAAS